MNSLYILLIAIIFILYLVFFFRVVYPNKEQSRAKKYFPLSLIMVITGILCGAVIYLDFFLSIPFEVDFYLLMTYIFGIILAVSVHLLPYSFRGRAILYALIYAAGWGTFGLLLIYIIYCVSPSLEPTTTENWFLIIGLFSFPLTGLGVWGFASEEKYLYKGVSDSLRKAIYMTIFCYCSILLAVGYAFFHYSTEWYIYLLTIGAGIGSLVSVVLLYRLWRKRKAQGLPW